MTEHIKFMPNPNKRFIYTYQSLDLTFQVNMSLRVYISEKIENR